MAKDEPYGPAYDIDGAKLQKFRRMAREGLATLTADQIREYGAAVRDAVLSKQRGALARECPSFQSNSASGTFHHCGKAIHAALKQQQTAALRSAAAQERRKRTPKEWETLYKLAMIAKHKPHLLKHKD